MSWGGNSYGELGDGSLKNIISIAAGSDFSVCLDKNGQVYTFGNNSIGQLGNGTTTSSSKPYNVPLNKKIISKIKKLYVDI